MPKDDIASDSIYKRVVIIGFQSMNIGSYQSWVPRPPESFIINSFGIRLTHSFAISCELIVAYTRRECRKKIKMENEKSLEQNLNKDKLFVDKKFEEKKFSLHYSDSKIEKKNLFLFFSYHIIIMPFFAYDDIEYR